MQLRVYLEFELMEFKGTLSKDHTRRGKSLSYLRTEKFIMFVNHYFNQCGHFISVLAQQNREMVGGWFNNYDVILECARSYTRDKIPNSIKLLYYRNRRLEQRSVRLCKSISWSLGYLRLLPFHQFSVIVFLSVTFSGYHGKSERKNRKTHECHLVLPENKRVKK